MKRVHEVAVMAAQCSAFGRSGVVSAAAPLAAQAGAAALHDGGNAYDAAVAAALAETVLLPPKCGFGGDLIALRLTGMATTLVLSLGQGALLLPTLLCGGLAIARRGWPTWVRVVLAALALAPFVLVHVDAGRAWPHSDARLLAAVVLGAVVYGGAALALAQSYAPTPGGAIPRSLLGAPLLLATLTVLLAAGLDPVTALLVTLLVLAAAAVTLALRSRRALALALDDTRPHLTA